MSPDNAYSYLESSTETQNDKSIANMSRKAKLSEMIIKTVLILCAFTLLEIYLMNYEPASERKNEYKNMSKSEDQSLPPGYLVWSPECKIISIDPLEADVMNLFTKQEYKPCSNELQLTSIEQNFEADTVKVKLHSDLKSKYLNPDQNQMECYYQEITRDASAEDNADIKTDEKFRLSQHQYFDKSFELPLGIEFILVQCNGSNVEDTKKINQTTVYTNAYAIVRRKPQVFESFKTSYPSRPLSLLMIGADSISRLNFNRAMPKTAKHLNDAGWFELRGYNKIDDNTFPNLMAILTGLNVSYIDDNFDLTKIGELDKCPFMWQNFKNSGYATGYAEDETYMGTFNFIRKGFLQQPTTHYLRPFALAAEKYLTFQMKHFLKFCLGYQHYADFIYQYAVDFATAYKNDPFFGLFWANTFSHSEILGDPSAMDERMVFYLEMLENRGVLNTSAVILFSDHGLRFGAVRTLWTGWQEERMPFMFIWLPTWFKIKYPDIARSLLVNRNRLTSPYDIHMMLKHILELSGRTATLPPAISCPECQSIFNEIPWKRSCQECGIATHWCTCDDYIAANITETTIQNVVNFVLESINQIVEKKGLTHFNSTEPLCAHLTLKRIILARENKVLNKNSTNQFRNYLVSFVASSDAKFESTVRSYRAGNTFEITGSISRINAYKGQSDCVQDNYLKKYCLCTKKMN